MFCFKDCQIVLDLTTSINFKKKTEIRKKITENGGVISYIVTKKVIKILVACTNVSFSKDLYITRIGIL